MKTIIFAVIIICLAVNSAFTQNITTCEVRYNCVIDSTLFDKTETFKASVEDCSPTTSNYLDIPKMKNCWIVKNWSEYSSMVKQTTFSPSIFNKYNLCVYVAASGGCNVPTAEVKVYSRGNERHIASYVMPMSLCKNMRYVIVSALLPKEYCRNISYICDFKKQNEELTKKFL